MKKVFYFLNVKFLVYVFFIAYFIIGIFLTPHYGLSWDEEVQRKKIGENNYEYIIGNISELDEFHRYYGPVFEIFLILPEKLFNIVDSQKIYILRHFFTFFVFYIGVVFFFLINKKIFKSEIYALIAVLMLVLHPRIFGHSFFNSKDIPFLSCFIISVYSLRLFLENKNYKTVFLHAFASTVLIGIRVLGVIIPFLTFAFLIFELLMMNKYCLMQKICKKFWMLYFLLVGGLVTLFWPHLWNSPVSGIIDAFQFMSNFNYYLDVLYLGNYIRADNLPWHYVLIWIFISTPIVYLVFFVFGIITIFKKICNNKVSCFNLNKIDFLLIIVWFFVPIILVLVLGSVIYDDWRHLYFVYPAFCVIATLGVWQIVNNLKIKNFKLGLVGVLFVFLNFTFVIREIYKFHPNENVYFNSIAKLFEGNLRYYFDIDYWGLSYRQALEYILLNDSSKIINIYVLNFPGELNRKILIKNSRQRIKYVKNISEADYFINDYRFYKDEFAPGSTFYSLSIDNISIIDVFKLKM